MAVTIDDIARETGFHRTTVSQVLSGNTGCYASESTRQLIRETAQRLDFVPNFFARSLRKRCSHTVGVVLSAPEIAGLQISPIAEALFQRGYMPLFCESLMRSDVEAQAVRALRQRGVDGLILHADSPEAELARWLPRDLPCVLIRNTDVPGRVCVVADRTRAFAAGVRWLAARGHRRIAFLGHDVRGALGDHTSSTCRKLAGYRAAMRRLGLFEERLVIDAGPLPIGGGRGFVREQARRFDGVTAVLAANDRLAVEVMSGLADLGRRVPEDCSIVGFDDTEFAVAVRPALTTFQARRAEVGAQAVQRLLDLIDGTGARSVTVVPRLMVRESAGACPRTRPE